MAKKEGKLRDEWVIKLSPCEVHSEAYKDPSLTTIQGFLGAEFGRCEFFETCPIIRREARAEVGADKQVRVLRKKIRAGSLSDKERNAMRRAFLSEMKGLNDDRGSLCIRRTAQQMAQDLVLVKMRSIGMEFEQAITDLIFFFAQNMRRSSFIFYRDYNWVQITGIDEVMGEIVQFALMIIGLNGSKP